jgi:hypothetical protein
MRIELMSDFIIRPTAQLPQAPFTSLVSRLYPLLAHVLGIYDGAMDSTPAHSVLQSHPRYSLFASFL